MFRGKLPVGGIALRRCAGMTSASAATGAAGLACATQFAVAASALGGSSTSAAAWLMAAPCAAMRFDSHGGNYQDTKGPAREPIGTKRSGAYLLDKADVLARVLEVVKNFEKVDAAKVTPESHFINDLGLDSLDVVEVVMALEQEFVLDIPDHEAEKIQSIPDAVDYLAANPMAK